MIWNPPLIEARFLRRYKRFFADVDINGKVEVAHVPNTGSLQGCLNADAHSLVQPATDPARKLKFTFQMIRVDQSWVGVNTANPPSLVKELLESKRVDHWNKFDSHQWEVVLNDKTRIDLVLWDSSQSFSKDHRLSKMDVIGSKHPLHFIEIKNVTLAKNGVALFPDCETTRGQKHLRELTELVQKGHSAEMVYVIQRSDCHEFAAAAHLDPEYARLFELARTAGVQITPLRCEISATEIRVLPEPIKLVGSST